MKIALYCDNNDDYRLNKIAKHLGRKHKLYRDGPVVVSSRDAVVIDAEDEATSMLERAKSAGILTVLLDGKEDDADRADVSFSAFDNDLATYRGPQYSVFPTTQPWTKHKIDKRSSGVFVHSDNLSLINKVLSKKHLTPIVWNGQDNPYDVFSECLFGIIKEGQVLAQALYYGFPALTFGSEDLMVSGIPYATIKPSVDSLTAAVYELIGGEYRRRALHIASQYYVQCCGSKKIAQIIEKSFHNL